MKKKLRSKGSLNVMKISRTLLLSVAFFTVNIWSHSLLAMEGAFSVNLKKLELVKEQERDGDELYISVTEFPKKGTPKTYQIPNSPSHWYFIICNHQSWSDIIILQKFFLEKVPFIRFFH